MLKYPCDEGIQHLCYWLLFFFCCRPWNWYFSGTTWSSESKADIFCREWQWFQTFSRGISLVYNKHPLLNVFPQLKQFIDQKLVLNFVVSRRAIELAFDLNLTLSLVYYLPYNSYDVSSESLVMDQLIIPKFIFSLFSSLYYLILYQYC